MWEVSIALDGVGKHAGEERVGLLVHVGLGVQLGALGDDELRRGLTDWPHSRCCRSKEGARCDSDLKPVSPSHYQSDIRLPRRDWGVGGGRLGRGGGGGCKNFSLSPKAPKASKTSANRGAPRAETPNAMPAVSFTPTCTTSIRLCKRRPTDNLGLSFCDGPGVRVRSVQPGGLADNSGLRPEDVVLSINSQSCKSSLDAARKLREGTGELLLTVDVQRAGRDD